MCTQATRNSTPVWSSKLPWKTSLELDTYRKIEQGKFKKQNIFGDNDYFGEWFVVSFFFFLLFFFFFKLICTYRLTCLWNNIRERSWSDGEDQQDKPVRSLNGFQHKKNTLQKGFFCFGKLRAWIALSTLRMLARQWPGPSVNLTVIQWAIEPAETAVQNCPSNHPCNLIKTTTQQLKSGVRRATFA